MVAYPSFESAVLRSLACGRADEGPIVYRRLELPPPRVEGFLDKDILVVPGDGLAGLARTAFRDIAFLLPPGRVRALRGILRDPRASQGDIYAARAMLRNARIAAEGELPLCQDTGTAAVYAWKGSRVFLDAPDSSDEDCLSLGAAEAYRHNRLRFSQLAPLGAFEERNTGTNLPLECDIRIAPGEEYDFIFVAKGGGSSNKTALYQETPALLAPEALRRFLERIIPGLGVAACPPYRIIVAIGGQTPEEALRAVKLAGTGALDALEESGRGDGEPLRLREWEAVVMEAASSSGWGAQMGGAYQALDARVIRLSRHSASCPVALGVSCAAHRQIRARVNREGFFLEDLRPGEEGETELGIEGIAEKPLPRLDLDRPVESVIEELRRYSVGTLLAVSGTITLARDAAHGRLAALLASGGPVPIWAYRPVFYAGPSETPPDRVSGSLGPTTSRRMDAYVEDFLSKGIFRLMIGKGERSPLCAEACARYGGAYFAALGGVAAATAKDFVVSSEVEDWGDLGMEAIRRVVVRNLPVLLAVDASGRDFYADIPGR